MLIHFALARSCQATVKELVEDSEDTYFGLGRKDCASPTPTSLWQHGIDWHHLLSWQVVQDGALDFDEFVVASVRESSIPTSFSELIFFE